MGTKFNCIATEELDGRGKYGSEEGQCTVAAARCGGRIVRREFLQVSLQASYTPN